jgi:hypothetical protein
MRNKFWIVVDPYAHYDNSEDIFSIPMDVAFPLQHLLLVFLMVMTKWLRFLLFETLKFCHHLWSNIPILILVNAIREFFYLKDLRLSKMKWVQ